MYPFFAGGSRRADQLRRHATWPRCGTMKPVSNQNPDRNPRPQGPGNPGGQNTDPKRRRRLMIAIPILTFLWVMVLFGNANVPPSQTVPLGQIIEAIGDKDIKQARIDDRTRVLYLEKTDGKIISAAYPEGYIPTLTSKLTEANVAVTVDPVPQPSLLGGLFSMMFPILLLVGLLVWFSKRGAAGAMGMGRLSSKKTTPVEPPQTRFTDVAGLDETVDELREIVELIEDPDRFAKLGAKPSRGFLLVGPPGTGKTLLAKAVAGEAGVPFFALSGSDFTEMFVGVGASRVRELFAKARAAAPAIIFVDEIDSVARQRGNSALGGNDERENTLNQLLAELDGFESGGVIFIGATNRVDILDPALLRPGRFDRKITVPLPDRRGREAILQVHAQGKPLDSSVELGDLAKRTPGFSGADLAYLVNEAALEAARLGASTVTNAHLQAALATSVLGKERKGALVTERDREIVAWHEAGHATAALILPDAADPVTVTIIPRGGAGGVTWMGGSDDEFLTRTQAYARLTVSMGGRAAEKILLSGDFTQGAHGDLSSATSLATVMISRYGMGSRLVSVDPIPGTPGSDRVADEASVLITEAAASADKLLVTHQALLETIATKLLEEETLDGDQLRELADAHLSTNKTVRRNSRPSVNGVQATKVRQTPPKRATPSVTPSKAKSNGTADSNATSGRKTSRRNGAAPSSGVTRS